MTRRRTETALFLAALCGTALVAADFEPNPSFDAAARLGDRAKGPHYQVQSPVTSDGFLLTYRIRSDFGEWEVEGRPLLEMRLKEVGALAELAELSKTKVFTDAVAAGVKNATIGQVETAKAFAENPVETVRGIPGGVSRMWKNAKAQAGDAYGDYKASKEESADKSTSEKTSQATGVAVDAGKTYAKKYLGTGAAERRWAQKLGVDPYTSNEALKKQIATVAKVDAAGRFGVRLVGIPGIPGLNYVRDLNKLVWETDPSELRIQNRKKLEATGAADAVLAKFFDNEWLSPTLQTALTQSIVDLEGVADRHRLVEQAAKVDSESSAWFLTRSVRLLAGGHAKSTPLVRVLAGRAAPIAESKSGAIVAGVASEYLSWSDSLEQGIDSIRAASPKARGFEILLAGEVTPRARQELAARGVKLVEGLAKEFEAAVAAPPGAK
jgi:hypothetical protein